MDRVLILAEQLGKELAKHGAVQKFLARQKELSSDAAAQEILDHYEKQVQKIADLERQGKPIETDDKHALADLQTQLSANPAVKNFMAAQVEYSDLLRKINQQVMAPLHAAEQGSDT